MTMNCRSLSVRTTNNDTERIGAEAIFVINFVRLLSLRAQSVLEETDKLQRSKDQVFWPTSALTAIDGDTKSIDT